MLIGKASATSTLNSSLVLAFAMLGKVPSLRVLNSKNSTVVTAAIDDSVSTQLRQLNTTRK